MRLKLEGALDVIIPRKVSCPRLNPPNQKSCKWMMRAVEGGGGFTSGVAEQSHRLLLFPVYEVHMLTCVATAPPSTRNPRTTPSVAQVPTNFNLTFFVTVL